jgi:antitoxin component YwqK of YwqJK toxin-antitoxin module
MKMHSVVHAPFDEWIRRAMIVLLWISFVQTAYSQDTIYIADDTIRVGGLEWDIEKDYQSKKAFVTKNPTVYGEVVSIFHAFHKREKSIEQIVFGYEKDGDFIPHGPARYYYPTGELLGKRRFEEGKLNGPAIDYYKNGMLKVISAFRNDSVVGEYKTYHDQGVVEAWCKYENGGINGVLYMFYNNGTLKSTSFFVNGIQQGNDTTYNESGDIWKIEQYENDLLHGPSITLHHNGKPASEFIFSEGLLIAVSFVKSPEGRPLEPGDFEDGNGIVNFYNESGLLKGFSKYKNGREVWYKEVVSRKKKK